MAENKVDKNGISMDKLLIEVLNSKSSFGGEMRNKISSTLDIVTKKIEKGIGTMKFNTNPVSITDVMGVNPKEQEKVGAQVKTQQKKLLKWIKEISKASNWKQLRKGANITDILGSDKIQNERFAKQYAILQKKILLAVKANIPTKVDVLPKAATSTAVEQPTAQVPEEVKAKEPPAFGIPGLEDKESMVIPPVDSNFNEEKPDTEGGLIENIISKISDLIETNKNESAGESADDSGGLLENITSKIIDLTSGNSDAKIGREAFQEGKGDPVYITEFNDKAVEQLTKALPGNKDEKKIKETMTPKSVKGSIIKSALKIAGIAALMGLFTFLSKNKKAVDSIKKFFKDTFLPWLKSFIKGIPKVLEFIGKAVFNLGKFIYKWVIKPFIAFGKHIGEGAFMITDWIIKNLVPPFKRMSKWINEKVIQPFIKFAIKVGKAIFKIEKFIFTKIYWPILKFAFKVGKAIFKLGKIIFKWVIDKFIKFGKAIGEGASMITDWITKKLKKFKHFIGGVWDDMKSAIVSIKDHILGIPKFLSEQLLKLRESFIKALQKIPWVGKLIKTSQEKQNEIEAEQKRSKLKRSSANESIARIEKRTGNKLTEEERGSMIRLFQGTASEADKKVVKNLRIKEKNSGTPKLNDFIWRSGKEPVSVSPDDTLIGAKEKITVENKNLDEQMHKLTSVMLDIKSKFDDLLVVNSKMLDNGKSGGGTRTPLPAIPNNIETNRALAYDSALNHKTKVWELLHGVT